MLMNTPVVSVIIPAYNCELFLADTISSVLNQSFRNFEIIVINDGSTDNTARIAENFVKSGKVKILHQNNSGVSAARNRGAEVANGKYLAFLDSDDIWLPDNLIEKLGALKDNPSCGLAHADCEFIDGKGRKTGDLLQGKTGAVHRDLLLWNGTVIPGPSSILVTAEAFNLTGGFDPLFSTAADQDFFFNLTAKFPVIRVPKILSQYRIHGCNMHMNIAAMEKDHLGVYKKAAKRKLFESAAFRRRCFSELYFILAGSWWVNGKSKFRALYFILKALFTHRTAWSKLLSKFA
jgi:glycosyltransferase involved in cell wall biosynthesis